MDFSTREISKSDKGHSWKPHLHTLVMGDRVFSSLVHGKPHLHAFVMQHRMYSSPDHGKPHLHALLKGDRAYSSLDHGKPHLHALVMEDRVYSPQDHGFVYSRPIPHCSEALHSHTITRRLGHKMKERQTALFPLTGNMILWIIKGPWNLQNLLEIINEVTK